MITIDDTRTAHLHGGAVLRMFVETGAHLLGGWRGLRAALPELALPPSPGPGTEDIHACRFALAGLTGGAPPPDVPTTLEMYERCHWQMRWAAFGFPIFSLTESLAASFVLTDPGSVSGEAVKLPFDSVLIELPWPHTPYVMDDMDEQPTGVRWIALHRVTGLRERADRDRIEAAYDATPATTQAQGLHREVKYRRAIQACEMDDMMLVRLIADDGLSIYESLPAPGAGPLRSWLAQTFGARYREAEMSTGRRDRIALMGARSFATNFCLYLAGLKQEKRVPRPSGGQSAKRKDGEPVPPLRWVLGREVKLSAQLRTAAHDYAARGERRKPWKLAARYVVRGHWRNQACGERWQEHKLVRIDPFWKGPTDGAVLTRQYRLEQEEQKEDPR